MYETFEFFDLNIVSDYQIFKRYCSNFEEVGKIFKSELRQDNNPSCGIFEKGSKLYYNDFAEHGVYGAVSYVMRKYNINFKQAISKIRADYINGKFGQKVKITRSYNKDKYNSVKLSNTVLKVKKRKWNDEDRKFWYDNYRITEELLTTYHVCPITHLWVNDNPVIKLNSLAYSYDYGYFNDVYIRKIYQPYNKDFKWIANVNNNIIQGIDNLTGSNTLVITSSLKDVMVWKNLFPKIDVIAPNSETSFIPEKILKILKKRFKKIIINFDNDDTGIESSKAVCKKYGLSNCLIHGEKDISDLMKNGVYGGKKRSCGEMGNKLVEIINKNDDSDDEEFHIFLWKKPYENLKEIKEKISLNGFKIKLIKVLNE